MIRLFVDIPVQGDRTYQFIAGQGGLNGNRGMRKPFLHGSRVVYLAQMMVRELGLAPTVTVRDWSGEDVNIYVTPERLGEDIKRLRQALNAARMRRNTRRKLLGMQGEK